MNIEIAIELNLKDKCPVAVNKKVRSKKMNTLHKKGLTTLFKSETLAAHTETFIVK